MSDISPRPWRVSRSPLYGGLDVIDANQHTVAMIPPRGNREENATDAYLVAAAPELLRVCRGILNQAGDCRVADVREAIRVVVDRAEGGGQ